MEIDIFRIDKKIREQWTKKEEEIVQIEKEIQEFQFILDEDQKSDLSLHVRLDLREKIEQLFKKKVKLEELIKISDLYNMEVNDLFTQKKNIAPQKISFMKKDTVSAQSSEMTKTYLDILRKYEIQIEDDLELSYSHRKRKDKNICTVCKSVEFIYHSDLNIQICEGCGKQEEKSFKSLSFKDISRVNMANKYTYERRIHFKDCINQYQGKQNATIDDKVYHDLEEQFRLHDLLNGDASIPRKQRFEKITKDHIMLFLKETGHTKHYEDIVLIYHNMTQKKVDDISYLENQLMEDFDKISDLYDKKYKLEKKIDRKSFINTQYILFQLLRRHKYPCKKEDFNMLKTLDRQSFHDDIVRDLFEQLNFNFTPIF